MCCKGCRRGFPKMSQQLLGRFREPPKGSQRTKRGFRDFPNASLRWLAGFRDFPTGCFQPWQGFGNLREVANGRWLIFGKSFSRKNPNRLCCDSGLDDLFNVVDIERSFLIHEVVNPVCKKQIGMGSPPDEWQIIRIVISIIVTRYENR